MTILKILTAPDPRLRAKAKPVAKVDAPIRKLMDDMLETMYAAPGVGLAATQVGVAKRVIVIDIEYTDEEKGKIPNPIVLANPKVIETSEELWCYEEGCLSVPEFYEEVERPYTCKVKGLNKEDKEIIIEAQGLLSTCLQHEIDHLDGTLFVDHLGRVKRQMILKKLQKVKKQQAVKPQNKPASQL